VVIVTGVCLEGVLGCAKSGAGDAVAPIDPAQIFWKLDLNTHAVTLSVAPPSNTYQLTATPLSAAGTPLTTTAPVTFTPLSRDSSVQVTLTGLITAHSPKTGTTVQIEAAQTIGAATLTDTVVVNVTATAPTVPVATLTLHVLPGDSPFINAQSHAIVNSSAFYAVATGDAAYRTLVSPQRTLSATLADQNGTVITSKIVRYWSSDPRVVGLATSVSSTSPAVTALTRGQATLYAATTLYGITVSDSVRVTVIAPTYNRVNIASSLVAGRSTPLLQFDPGTVEITPGGTVEWTNPVGQPPIDIVFDDSTNVVGGNIPAFAFDSAKVDSATAKLILCGQICNASGNRRRLFPVAGTYSYRSTLFGTTGKVVVISK
jgi:hypothetical protein